MVFYTNKTVIPKIEIHRFFFKTALHKIKYSFNTHSSLEFASLDLTLGKKCQELTFSQWSEHFYHDPFRTCQRPKKVSALKEKNLDTLFTINVI